MSLLDDIKKILLPTMAMSRMRELDQQFRSAVTAGLVADDETFVWSWLILRHPQLLPLPAARDRHRDELEREIRRKIKLVKLPATISAGVNSRDAGRIMVHLNALLTGWDAEEYRLSPARSLYYHDIMRYKNELEGLYRLARSMGDDAGGHTAATRLVRQWTNPELMAQLHPVMDQAVVDDPTGKRWPLAPVLDILKAHSFPRANLEAISLSRVAVEDRLEPIEEDA